MYYVAITTRNRQQSFYDTYNSVKQFTDNIIVVDDASDINYSNADFRFNEIVGIPKAKNKCIELFMNTNSEHLFLLDDDVIIKDKAFFDRYIQSKYNHLCYSFTPIKKKENDIKIHHIPNGCAMYFNRICFDVVGGFDTKFGLGKYEHLDLSRRIYNVGLTPYPYIDLIGSRNWIKSLDNRKEIKRSFSIDEMSSLLKKGRNYFLSKKDSIEFIDYG